MNGMAKFGCWDDSSENILKEHFPLHRACRDGDVEGLSLLLHKAQHGVYVEDSFYGWTPAHWAAYFGKLSCLTRLIEQGVSCDATTLRLNQSPSHLAAHASRPHCLKWLLHVGAALDRQDYLGETAVHKAARTGSMECTSLLTAHGARLFIRNNGGLTAAELAASCGHTECATYLQTEAARQDGEARGVYQHAREHVTPVAPFDVTAREHCLKGLNGGHLPTLSRDCAMDESDAMMAAAAGGDAVTVNARKRTRECDENGVCKRVRSTENLVTSTAVSPRPLCASATPATSVTTPPVADERLVEMSPRHSPLPYESVLAMSTEPMQRVILPDHLGPPYRHNPEKFCCPFV